jgi:hypothetical protein
MPDDGQSRKPLILSILDHRQNPLGSKLQVSHDAHWVEIFNNMPSQIPRKKSLIKVK